MPYSPGGNAALVAISPDGRTLAFVASSASSAPTLWLREIAAVATRPLLGTENAQNPFWSPDSRWLGFYAGGKVKKVPAAGGAKKKSEDESAIQEKRTVPAGGASKKKREEDAAAIIGRHSSLDEFG